MALEPHNYTPPSSFNKQHSLILNAFNTLSDNKTIATLHRHQIDAVLAIRNFFLQPNNLNTSLCVLPTGSGKSGIAVLAPYILDSNRTLIITPSVSISLQLADDFGEDPAKAFLVRTGVFEKVPFHQKCRPSIYTALDSSKALDDNLYSHSLVIANAHKFSDSAGKGVSIQGIPSNAFDLIIVDEAHHYPAPTWKNIVNHFQGIRKIFLTATPFHKNKLILPIQPCYKLTRAEAISRNIIRPLDFIEVNGPKDQKYEEILKKMKEILELHDQQDSSCVHQAMVLMQYVGETDFFVQSCDSAKLSAGRFVSGDNRNVVDKFKDGSLRVLVVVGRLLEGFDNKHVSVVVILRNVAPASRVLFSQFVGRAVRKSGINDTIKAVVLSHVEHSQRQNFYQLDELAEVDPIDDDFSFN